ncbi:unnamed protein product, partial [Owenia fusiformis]
KGDIQTCKSQSTESSMNLVPLAWPFPFSHQNCEQVDEITLKCFVNTSDSNHIDDTDSEHITIHWPFPFSFRMCIEVEVNSMGLYFISNNNTSTVPEDLMAWPYQMGTYSWPFSTLPRACILKRKRKQSDLHCYVSVSVTKNTSKDHIHVNDNKVSDFGLELIKLDRPAFQKNTACQLLNNSRTLYCFMYKKNDIITWPMTFPFLPKSCLLKQVWRGKHHEFRIECVDHNLRNSSDLGFCGSVAIYWNFPFL